MKYLFFYFITVTVLKDEINTFEEILLALPIAFNTQFTGLKRDRNICSSEKLQGVQSKSEGEN